MRKSLSTVWIAVLLFSLGSLVVISSVDAAAADKIAVRESTSSLYLNNQYQQIQGYNIHNTNYYKLRDIAAAFAHTPSEFDVIWNSQTKGIEIKLGQAYKGARLLDNKGNQWDQTYATPFIIKMNVGGTTHTLQAYTINQSSYVQLRDLAQIIDFEVYFNKRTSNIELTSRVPDNAYRLQRSRAAEIIVRSGSTSSKDSRWAQPITSYLYTNSDGTLTTVDAEEKIYIKTYDASFKRIRSKTLDYELPIFGAFYSDSSYNYLVFGQENPKEDDKKEVIRIVKYDKQFKRISSVSVKKAYTIAPFHVGSARIAVKDNLLVLHTSRLRYMTEDGLNHQSQLTVLVDTNKMTVKNNLGEYQNNHVSHSFDQYVLFDDSNHVLLDHGDAFPRSIVLHKSDGDSYTDRDVVNIPGEIGANVTGVSIGGFEPSSSSYLVAYNTIDHAKAYDYTSFDVSGVDVDDRDIKIAAVPRDKVAKGAIKYTQIATYIGSKKKASIPKLVKINDKKLAVLWQEFELMKMNGDSEEAYLPTSVKYVTLDHQGKKIGKTQELKYFKLGDMQPIVYNKKIVWKFNDGYDETFYHIPIE